MSQKQIRDRILLDADDEWIRHFFSISRARNSIYISKSILGVVSKEIIGRFILDCPKGFQVDHINRNIYDNRKSNLRICTAAQNLRNKVQKSTSPYIGVRIDLRMKKKQWQAYTQLEDGTFKSLGYFYFAKDAALRRDEFCKERFGGFSMLNFPGGSRGSKKTTR